MRKILYSLLAVLALAASLAACGSSHKLSAQESKQANAATASADKAVQRCLPTKDGAPDPLVLRTKAGRHQFMACAVPPSKRVAFDACVTKVVLHGLPTKNRLKTGFEGCLAKVEA